MVGPPQRTTAGTVQEHLDDHNLLHALETVTWVRNGPSAVAVYADSHTTLGTGAALGSVIRSFQFQNTTNASVQFRSSITATSGASMAVGNALMWGTTLPPYGSYEWAGRLFLPENYVFKAKQETASAITATATLQVINATPTWRAPRLFGPTQSAVASSSTSLCAGAASGTVVKNIHVVNCDTGPEAFRLFVSTTSTPTISIATAFVYEYELAPGGTWIWEGELYLSSSETLYGQTPSGSTASVITTTGYAEDL